MTKTVLITLGRLPTALDLARGFHEIGWRVIIAEPFSWHLCRPSRFVARSYQVTAPRLDPERYRAEILAIAIREQVTLIAPVMEETMHLAALHGHLPSGIRLNTPPMSEILDLHSKRAFNARARGLGLPAPESYGLEQPEAIDLVARGPVIVKPEFSCSGRGLAIVPMGDDLPPMDRLRPSLAQRFIAGAHFSSFTIAHHGRVLATVVYRAAVTSGTVAVAFDRVEDQLRIERWIVDFCSATKHSGFLAFDFILDADGVPYAIECNPRLTSGAHFIEPADLAQAILTPETASIRFRPQRQLQQFYPCLTEIQASLFRRKPGWRAHAKVLFKARDVAWSGSDPLPFLMMPLTSLPILRQTLFGGLSFAEAATTDIEWIG